MTFGLLYHFNKLIYLTGLYQDSTLFGPLTTPNSYGVFTVKLNNQTGGEYIWSPSKEKFIHVYPNPSTGLFTIEGIATESWQAYNAMGQLVKAGAGSQVNLQGYARGVYLLRVGRHTEKLVLE